MRIWTRGSEEEGWTCAGSAVAALAGIARDPEGPAVVVCDSTESDLEDLDAFVLVAEGLGARRSGLAAACAHPTVDWLTRLERRGLGDLRYADCSEDGPPRISGISAAESLRRTCPFLHTRRTGGAVLSVCGAHSDRLVLSPRQIEGLCTKNSVDCPYRGDGAEDA